MPRTASLSSSPAFKDTEDISPLGDDEIRERIEQLQREQLQREQLKRQASGSQKVGQKVGRKVGRPPKSSKIVQKITEDEAQCPRIRKPSRKLQESMEVVQEAEALRATKRTRTKQKLARRT